MKLLLKSLPWLCLALFVTEIVMVMKPKADGQMRTAEFGRLPAPKSVFGPNVPSPLPSSTETALELG